MIHYDISLPHPSLTTVFSQKPHAKCFLAIGEEERTFGLSCIAPDKEPLEEASLL